MLYNLKSDSSKRVINEKDALNWAKIRKFTYFEVSSCDSNIFYHIKLYIHFQKCNLITDLIIRYWIHRII